MTLPLTTNGPWVRLDAASLLQFNYKENSNPLSEEMFQRS
jgi:hypothetical protein